MTLVHARPDLGAFAITGKDRLPWLNGLVTCDLAKLQPGGGAYGLAVGKTGRISAELWFVAGPDEVLVLGARDRLPGIRDHFDKHLVMEDAEMSDPLACAVLFVHGPQARAFVAGRPRAAMVDWTGRGDAGVLVVDEDALSATRDALVAASGTLVDDARWEATRIAWGLPKMGIDYDEQTLPQEASLEKVAVSFEKGCYLGQEAVFMLEKRGHAKKRLMRLAIEGDGAPPRGAALSLPDGGAAGEVTSATATDSGALALGYVKYKHAVADQALLVEGRAARVLGPAAEPRQQR